METTPWRHELGPAASGMVNISVKGGAAEGSRMTVVPSGQIRVDVKEEFAPNEETNSPTFVVHSGPAAQSQVRDATSMCVWSPQMTLAREDQFGYEIFRARRRFARNRKRLAGPLLGAGRYFPRICGVD